MCAICFSRGSTVYIAMLDGSLSDRTDQDVEKEHPVAMRPEAPVVPCGQEALDVAVIDQLDSERDRELVCISGVPHSNDLNSYSIFDRVPPATKLALIKGSPGTPVLKRAMGSMCGMAVGDAMRHRFEFMPAQNEPDESRFDLPELQFYGESNCFRLCRGQWTDDAAMVLCMADSIIMKRAFDGSDMCVLFWCW
ncbi:unnamed protein product [Prorocentrum cordatum]|uniref:Uncharacterized protein n=1 Tax=Prorocentrum cordatum TaxID=2364126 RepID=A0ABN9R715_9DINO|nr:unnamed protein product [Polarella glacialis]